MQTTSRVSLWLLALLAVACGQGTPEPAHEHEHPHGEQPAPQASQGELRFTLHPTPDPMRVGQNEVMLSVTDSSGAVQEGCNLTLTPWMPAHGHGAPDVPVVTAKGGGQYHASPVTLSMPGRWELRVQATCGALQGEHVEPYDIPG